MGIWISIVFLNLGHASRNWPICMVIIRAKATMMTSQVNQEMNPGARSFIAASSFHNSLFKQFIILKKAD